LTAPKWFTDALALMDPLLSVRKSVVTSHWVIERKAVISADEIGILIRRRDRIHRWITTPHTAEQKDQIHKNRKEWQSLCDEVESAQRGKRIISRPRVLNQEVYNDICKADIRRYGGHARFSTDMERAEEKREEDQERMLSNKRKAMSAEVYDMLGFMHRKKGTELDHGHQDLGYLLHGRHTKPDDAPLVTLSDF
jgi:hypothetical protein